MTKKTEITVIRVVNGEYAETYPVKRVQQVGKTPRQTFKTDVIFIEGLYRPVFAINGGKYCVVTAKTKERKHRR